MNPTTGFSPDLTQTWPSQGECNKELYTDLRFAFDNLDTLLSESIVRSAPLPQPLVLLRRKIRLARAYQALNDQSQTESSTAFRELAIHAYHYFELIHKLEKAQYLTRKGAITLTIRAARILELSDPEVAKMFGVSD